MHIKRLHIDSFKCLQDFDINFDTDNGGSAAILIGENGTGKSSMMEMIIRIFMSIYSLQYNTSRSRTRIITGNYEIEYTYASKTIKIQMQNDRYNVWEDGNQILSNARSNADTVSSITLSVWAVQRLYLLQGLLYIPFNRSA